MMKYAKQCFLAFLLTGGMGQAVNASPHIESRTIPAQPGTISVAQGEGYQESLQSPALSAEVLDQISALQREVQELRGLVETQEHELKRVEKSQQTLFLNLEKQLTDAHPKKGGAAGLFSGAVASLKSPHHNASVEHAPAVKKEVPEKPAVAAETDASLIKTAEGFLKQKKYKEAEESYQAYLLSSPTGEFAPTVYYTLGEIYWTEWHTEKSNTLLLEKAVHAFSDVANGFPEHAKAKDALLKIGLVEIEKGNYQMAAQYFRKVIEKYPQSPSAKIAELRLQKLTQDGRIS